MMVSAALMIGISTELAFEFMQSSRTQPLLTFQTDLSNMTALNDVQKKFNAFKRAEEDMLHATKDVLYAGEATWYVDFYMQSPDDDFLTTGDIENMYHFANLVVGLPGAPTGIRVDSAISYCCGPDVRDIISCSAKIIKYFTVLGQDPHDAWISGNKAKLRLVVPCSENGCPVAKDPTSAKSKIALDFAKVLNLHSRSRSPLSLSLLLPPPPPLPQPHPLLPHHTPLHTSKDVMKLLSDQYSNEKSPLEIGKFRQCPRFIQCLTC
jgi:hypothetical protein